MGIKIGYGRVSTDKQAYTHSLEHQLARLNDAGVQEILYDIESGSEVNRENFDKLLAKIRTGEASHVVATKWDRVTRSVELYLEIEKVVRDYGIVLEFLDGGEADLNTPDGRLYALLQVSFSTHERERIIERIRQGFEGRRKRNAAWGSCPWGYIVSENQYKLDKQVVKYRVPFEIASQFDNIEQDPLDPSYYLVSLSKADIARDAFNYFFQDRTINGLKKYMSNRYCLHDKDKTPFTAVKKFPHSSAGIKRWLGNPVFQGHTAYLKFHPNGTAKSYEEFDLRLNTHPEEKLISEEEADEIRAILEASKKAFGNPKARFYLSGLIYCDQCGRRCNLISGGNHSYYKCPYSSTICNSGKSTTLTAIEKAIIAKLVVTARELSGKSEIIPASADLTEVQSHIEQIKQIEGYEFSPELKATIKNLQKKEKALLESYRNESTLIIKLLKIPESQKINFWYSLTEQERNVFYKRLISRVSILNGEVLSVTLKIASDYISK